MSDYRTHPVPEAFWDKFNSERSQARISKAEREHPDQPWCTVCGAVLNPQRAWTVHIVGGGGSFLHRDDESSYTDHGDDMGCWDLGPECARLAPAAYRKPYEKV